MNTVNASQMPSLVLNGSIQWTIDDLESYSVIHQNGAFHMNTLEYSDVHGDWIIAETTHDQKEIMQMIRDFKLCWPDGRLIV